MIDTYKELDNEKIIGLWNETAVKIGYKEMEEDSFAEIISDNQYFNRNLAFVMHDQQYVVGFACGCIGDDLPLGKTSGYITCVLLKDAYETTENYQKLIELLEKSFLEAGKTQSEILFFNPMMLSWYIQGTNNHEHNNAPGVFKHSKLYYELLKSGYMERATENAMYLNLKNFVVPERMIAKEKKADNLGYEVALFDKNRHCNVDEMLRRLNNPLWEKEITQSTLDGIGVLVAAHNGNVVGFAGPIIRQKSGRGYFTGIGVVKEHEGHGLGTILFYQLCQEEKKVGAQYMSLYTGADNPAGTIYRQAGFEVVQEFAVMRKMI